MNIELFRGAVSPGKKLKKYVSYRNTSTKMMTGGVYAACAAATFLLANASRGAGDASALSDKSADVLKSIKSPTTPVRPWQPPDVSALAKVLKVEREPP